MSGRRRRVASETPVEQLIAGLTVDELREVVSATVDRHDDVERQVRLIAGRGRGDLAQLRAEIDRGLRTRRFLGYGESAGWARAARPIVAELESAVAASPSRALVELLQRAVGHVVKVIMHADDSDGLIGDLASELLTLHARACDAGVADPVELAAWMVRFGFDDQDSSRSIQFATRVRSGKPGCPRTATPSARAGTATRLPFATRASGWRSLTATSTGS